MNEHSNPGDGSQLQPKHVAADEVIKTGVVCHWSYTGTDISQQQQGWLILKLQSETQNIAKSVSNAVLSLIGDGSTNEFVVWIS